MLKIKDNVDLKELEKFNFKLDSDEWYMRNDNGFVVLIKPLSKKIVLRTFDTSLHESIDVLYDLIQAGIVEKI